MNVSLEAMELDSEGKESVRQNRLRVLSTLSEGICACIHSLRLSPMGNWPPSLEGGKHSSCFAR